MHAGSGLWPSGSFVSKLSSPFLFPNSRPSRSEGGQYTDVADARKPAAHDPLRHIDGARAREAMRLRHFSPRTEQAYLGWMRRYHEFHGRRDPAKLGSEHVMAFLNALATRGQVAVSTQNQALAALLFLYREVLEAAIGGFHLFAATDEQLEWTAGRLRAVGLRHLLGAHCTGIEAVFRLRQLTGLARRDAVVAAVGSSFTLGSGIDALALAK